MKRSVLNLLLAVVLLLAIVCFKGAHAGQQRISKTPKKVKVNKYKAQEEPEEKPKKEMSREVQKQIKAEEEAKAAKEAEEKELRAKKKEETKKAIEEQKKKGLTRKGKKNLKYVHDPADGSLIEVKDSK